MRPAAFLGRAPAKFDLPWTGIIGGIAPNATSDEELGAGSVGHRRLATGRARLHEDPAIDGRGQNPGMRWRAGILIQYRQSPKIKTSEIADDRDRGSLEVRNHHLDQGALCVDPDVPTRTGQTTIALLQVRIRLKNAAPQPRTRHPGTSGPTRWAPRSDKAGSDASPARRTRTSQSDWVVPPSQTWAISSRTIMSSARVTSCPSSTRCSTSEYQSRFWFQKNCMAGEVPIKETA